MTPVEALCEVLFHIRGVRDMMEGVDFQRITTTYAMTCAIERAGEVVGARVKALPPELLARHPDVHWKELIAHTDMLQRPRLPLDMTLRWWLATRLIPPLEKPVTAMLEEARRVDSTLGS